jgi:hypothetical protein
VASISTGVLSGSTDGDPVRVAATSIASGTTIHTASSTAGDVDFVELWVTNTDTAERTITISWGGVTDPNHLLVDAYTVPINAKPIRLAAFQAISNGGVISAAASVTNVLNVTGRYVRYSA